MADLQFVNKPYWMNNTFIKACIKSIDNLENGDEIHVDKVDLNYVVPIGENYMSITSRATVKYRVNAKESRKNEQQRVQTFIVKSINEQIKSLSEPLVKSETLTYVNDIPMINDLLSKHGVMTRMTCRYIHHLEPPMPYVLVIDDLKPLGYLMCDRREGLDLDHSKLVIKNMAEFHAASMCYFNNQPLEVREKYKNVAFDMMRTQGGDMTKKYSQTLLMKIPTLKSRLPKQERYQKIVTFLDKFAEVVEKEDFIIGRYQPGNKFNAFNHGDLWVNNIMFKYDSNGKPVNAIFVDFQACTYQSIAYDFNFFFVSSTDKDVMKNRYDELCKVYFDTLIQTLKMINYAGDFPTLEEFKKELRENVTVVMLIVMYMAPIILSDKNSHTKTRDNGESYTFEEMTELQKKSVSSLYYETMDVAFDVLLEKGYFDDYSGLLPIIH